MTHGYTYSGSNDANPVAWYGVNSGNVTHEAGTKAANELGISDMSGNVWEWCWDWYSIGGAFRRIRGGSWNFLADRAEVSYRDDASYPGGRSGSGGFRLACNSGQ
jgi:formylglycine-generating enzyme required for sulfatase activity